MKSLCTVGRLAVFVNVESFFLHTFGNAEAVDFVESFEDDESHACCPCAYYECTEYLRSEKAPACTVKQSLTGGKQSGEDGSRETADAVYGTGPYGVVNFQCPVDEFHRINHQDAADGADDYRPERRNHVTTGRDAYQSGQNAIQCQRQGGFAIFHPAYRQCKETACAGCQIGGEEYMRDGPCIVRSGCCQL